MANTSGPRGMTSSYGPVKVGLMALHDREFFERLLKNPRKTLTDRADLNLNDADVEQVVQLIQRQSGLSPADALAKWDRYHAMGDWDPSVWGGRWGDTP